MAIDFNNYKALFQTRNENRDAYDKWLNASMGVLSAYSKGTEGDNQKAAKALAADWDAESLSYLSYAGFCFWHEPIKGIAAKTGLQDPHWSAKVAFRSLIDDCLPPAKGSAQRTRTNYPTPEKQAKLDETTRRLNLVTIACQARVNKDEDFKKFHEALFTEVVKGFVSDKDLQAHAESWPEILDKNGVYKSDKIRMTTDRGPLLTRDSLQEVEAHDPQAISERVSAIAINAAKKLRPDIFSDLPEVVPTVQPNTAGSGGYSYRPERADRPASASYQLDSERSDVSGTFEMLSLTCAVHETYHILQCHLMAKDKNPATNPFWCEAQTYPDASIPQVYDRPCRTYPYFPHSVPAKAGYDAYVARPTENYTYPFCEGIESALCSLWKNQVMPKEPFVKSDIAQLMAIAKNNKLIPTEKRETIFDYKEHLEMPPLQKFLPVCDELDIEKSYIPLHDGTKIYCERDGEQGEPIVFIHGGPGASHQGFHGEAITELAKSNQVILYDQDGCGDTKSAKNATYSVDKAVDQLEELREKLGYDKWAVLGHSYGGTIAYLSWPQKIGQVAKVERLV